MEWAISQHTHAQQIANHWRGARMGIKSNSLMSSESPWLINLEQFSNVTFSIGTRQLNAMISLKHEQKQKRRQTNKNKAAERHTASILTDYQFLEAFKSFVCVRAHAHLLIHSFTHKEIVKHKKWKLSKFGCIYCLFLFIFFEKKEKLNEKCFSKYLNGNFSYAPHGHIAIRALLERDTFQFFLNIF